MASAYGVTMVGVCVVFVLLFCFCIVGGCLPRRRPSGEDRSEAAAAPSYAQPEDLRRLRERIVSERGRDRRFEDGAREDNDGSRDELIEKNIFSRRIHREDSVRKLSNLLAISRGRAVDEEVSAAVPRPVPNADEIDSESLLPMPSAPPGPVQSTAGAIATAIALRPAKDGATVAKNAKTLEQIHHLLGNLAQTIEKVASSGGDASLYQARYDELQGKYSEMELQIASAQGSERKGGEPSSQTAAPGNAQRLECPICLEEYCPNDTIAWAKDGGDPPVASSSDDVGVRNDTGCDHIFHKHCFVAWLQDHDECPMCRRMVVHADAETRFAGWQMK